MISLLTSSTDAVLAATTLIVLPSTKCSTMRVMSTAAGAAALPTGLRSFPASSGWLLANCVIFPKKCLTASWISCVFAWRDGSHWQKWANILPNCSLTSPSLPWKPRFRPWETFSDSLSSLTNRPMTPGRAPPASLSLCKALSHISSECHSSTALSKTSWHCSNVPLQPSGRCRFACSTSWSRRLRLNASRNFSCAAASFWCSIDMAATVLSNCLKPSGPALKPPCSFNGVAWQAMTSFVSSSPRRGSIIARSFHSWTLAPSELAACTTRSQRRSRSAAEMSTISAASARSRLRSTSLLKSLLAWLHSSR
mmetsp:Transcript_102070/g.263904  ORF Transcript_102070/g.263904 Transcript_102070/m.263904 type:complete len:310 (-) Transcript_102070:1261-2190(-)